MLDHACGILKSLCDLPASCSQSRMSKSYDSGWNISWLGHESRLLILNVDSNEIEQLPSNFGQLLGVHRGEIHPLALVIDS